MTNNLPIYASPEFIANNEVRVIEALELDADIVRFRRLNLAVAVSMAIRHKDMIRSMLTRFRHQWDSVMCLSLIGLQVAFEKLSLGQAVVSKFAISDYMCTCLRCKGSSYFYRNLCQSFGVVTLIIL